MEGGRAAGGLAPVGFVAPVIAGAQRHHHAVERDRGANRLGRDVVCDPDSVHRLWPQALPALNAGCKRAAAGCWPTASWRPSPRRTPPLPAPCRAVPCRAVPCRAVPCRAVPCRAVPCRAVPCRAVPCRAVNHHHKPEPGSRARQVVVNQPQALVHRHERGPARAATIARPAVGYRTERGHDGLRRRRHPEPALPGPLDPQRSVVQTVHPAPQHLAAQGVRALPDTQLGFLECGRAWRGCKRLATDRIQPRQRLQYPSRQDR